MKFKPIDYALALALVVSVVAFATVCLLPDSVFRAKEEVKVEKPVKVEVKKPVAPKAKKKVRKVADEQLVCLADNIYFEARGESKKGWGAVTDVVWNRVASKHFPNTPCQVIKQKRKNVCQFSWVCDKRFNALTDHRETEMYKEIYAFVQDFKGGATKGATFYHATRLNVSRLGMGDKLTKTTKIGKHVFYRI